MRGPAPVTAMLALEYAGEEQGGERVRTCWQKLNVVTFWAVIALTCVRVRASGRGYMHTHVEKEANISFDPCTRAQASSFA